MTKKETLESFLRAYGTDDSVRSGLTEWVTAGGTGTSLAEECGVSRSVVSDVGADCGFSFPAVHKAPYSLRLYKPPSDFVAAIILTAREHPDMELRTVIDAVMKAFHETPRWQEHERVEEEEGVA
ncbi:MAG: hypothetical protein ACYCOR_10640 [Acidobacteriaceae bacterium]